jgi:hypothetical protein
MKNKTLLEAATDMLLNKTESVVNEGVPSINMKNLKAEDIFGLIEKATDSLYDKYIGEKDDDIDIRHAYDEFVSAFEELNSAFENSGLFEASESEEEDDEQHDLEEATEVDNIAAKVAELKVGDKTNFGVVVALGGNSVTFKGKDLPKTKITFNQRKMGSRDYVLSALRMIK